jgi:hypothetical protein
MHELSFFAVTNMVLLETKANPLVGENSALRHRLLRGKLAAAMVISHLEV